MARTVCERAIDNRTARAKLRPSGKPYWRAIDIGLHLGYRKGLRGGRWVMRRYLGDETYAVETIVTADDNQDAGGTTNLSFYQAQEQVKELVKKYRRQTPDAATLTVRDAISANLHARQSRDQRWRLTRHVLGDEIVDKPLASLTEPALIAWRRRLPSGLVPATARRISTDLRPALNAAAKTHRKDLPADLLAIIQHGLESKQIVASGAREAQVLPDADMWLLIEATWEADSKGGWDGDLARLIIVLAATGARFSQVVRMTVADVQSRGR